jgi:peptidoglycan L-alanyl-D-glutamate endopeptidase CwlK
VNVASRLLSDLLPAVQTKAEEAVNLCRKRGIEPLIYCTYRSSEEQNELFAQGRTKPGRIVTNARGGLSWHQWRRAIDVVPLLHGKPLWVYRPTDPHWTGMVEVFKLCGWEWAGDWKGFREFVHFQITDGFKLEDMPK